MDGKEISNRFNYDKPGLSALIKWLPAGSHCVMEVTGPYYLKLAFRLYEHGFQVSVINPLVIRRFTQMRLKRTKTDKADARMIAAYGELENPGSWQPPAQYMVTLQHLDAMVEMLDKHRTALSNQLEAFSAGGMMEKDVKAILTHNIRQLDTQISKLEKRIDQIIASFHGKMLRRLTTIPGIGKKTATALIVSTGGFTRFRSSKQISAYVGLSPRIYQSGKSIKGKAGICKMGMSRIRAKLYLCSWSAKRYNKACKEMYERLIAKGKAKMVALIAIANKLIKQAFAIATKGTAYEPDYVKKICF